jgi:branched-chain amino acid transport system permease protein
VGLTEGVMATEETASRRGRSQPMFFRNETYWLNVLTNASFLAFASMGVWVTFAIGRVNIAQGAFAMIGGYITAILSVWYGASFWLCLPVAAAVSVVVGVGVGWPLLRLKGVYFAMVTLSLTEVGRLFFLNTKIGGITGDPFPRGIDSMLAFYLFAAVLLTAGVVAVWRLSSSRIGRIFRAIRGNEELAASVGINVPQYRVFAFGLCSAMGGIAGACFASLQQNIFPGTYTVSDSINFMLYCFLGGLDFILGPIVGAFTLVVAFELLGSIQKYQALLYGVLMIVLMIFLPNGILSLGRRRGG